MFELLKELKTFLEEVLAELYQKRADKSWATPQVFIGALPPKDHTSQDEPPFVIVRPTDGVDDGFSLSEVGVCLIVGAHTSEAMPQGIEAGFNELLNVLTRIRQALLTHRILAERYEIQAPIKWKIGGKNENQPHPHYLAVIETRWAIPAIQAEWPPLEDLT